VTLAAISFDWSVNRAAGIAAMLLASITVALGVLSSSGPGLGREVSTSILGSRGEGRSLHEAMSIATLVAVALHGIAFAADGFFGAGIVGTVVPFASPYRPLSVAVGQVAGYGLAALGLTFYLRRRIGPARWRSAHRWIVAFWALAVLHSFLSGSDAGRLWFQIAIIPPVVAAVVVFGLHVVQRAAAMTPPTPPPPPPTPPPPHAAAQQPVQRGLLWSDQQ
jgi:sulfoxide reductase heme-binding subunit YedZ